MFLLPSNVVLCKEKPGRTARDFIIFCSDAHSLNVLHKFYSTQILDLFLGNAHPIYKQENNMPYHGI